MWWAMSLVMVGAGALIMGVAIGLALGFTRGAESSGNYERGFVAGRVLEREDRLLPGWEKFVHPLERAVTEMHCEGGEVLICHPVRPGEEAAAPRECSRGAGPPLATNRAPQGGVETVSPRVSEVGRRAGCSWPECDCAGGVCRSYQRMRKSTEEIIRAHEESGA